MCLYNQGAVMHYFLDEVLEHVFNFLTSYKDRNAVSMVCHSWYRVEKFSRGKVFVGNCYAISPERVISRFPRLRSLTLKGKPHFAFFNSVPPQWGGHVYPWIQALSNASVNLEELRLKRMVVSDQGLGLLSRSFPNFKSLVLVSCDGFTTDGLAAIASNCRHLRELDLQENKVEDCRGQWLSCFPDSCTSIVSLNFECLKGEVNLAALEGLVARCKNLTSLRLNRSVPLRSLHRILKHSPQLTDLGTGSFVCVPNSNACMELGKTLKCSSVRSLSGFFDVSQPCLPSVYPLCANLTSLNLSYSPGICCAELIKLVQHCRKLERLWVLDTIRDEGLFVVASNCTDLKELRVFPSHALDLGYNTVTEEGLVAVSAGCPKLSSLLYFCQQMTNAALVAVAKNCPNFTRFRLYALNPTVPDAVTKKPLDEGFGEIAKSCKGLKRLSVSGHLTDQVFLYIGMYAEQLEMLSIAFAGNSDKGMLYVLNGCKKLRKLQIRGSPFGDDALLANVGKYETMRSLWMSSCEVTMGACKVLAKKMPRLNVEIIKETGEEERDNDGLTVKKMYLYRTLVGHRKDAPGFVWTL